MSNLFFGFPVCVAIIVPTLYSCFLLLCQGSSRISWRFLSGALFPTYVAIQMYFCWPALLGVFGLMNTILTVGTIHRHESRGYSVFSGFSAYYGIRGTLYSSFDIVGSVNFDINDFSAPVNQAKFLVIWPINRTSSLTFTMSMGIFWWFIDSLFECDSIVDCFCDVFWWKRWSVVVCICCRVCIQYWQLLVENAVALTPNDCFVIVLLLVLHFVFICIDIKCLLCVESGVHAPFVCVWRILINNPTKLVFVVVNIFIYSY